MQKYIKAFCWLLLLSVSACQEHRQTNEDKPDAVRDLLIDRSFWKEKTTDQHKGINLHQLAITNTSHQYTYRHIEVRFDYYNRDHQKIDSSIHVVNRTLGPRAVIKIDGLEMSQTKEGTTAATATIVKASAE